ncbi:hypothetical protein K435DRAFT_646769 [Dendrothele bispora CBS 962.96]|uniref:AB hydrolase-1 domain-containing protein n=1 Tax=Dendrothele bispora (strain CBS 962.96) TaxID=1314807 RepID=A0A4S8MRG6_DENBC|nr:hypothetical protein K435DRAFT_646769 [Dendrothele bispora CBS 962.96]
MPSSHPQPSSIPPPPSGPQYAFPDASKILSLCFPHPISSQEFLPKLPTPQREPIWGNDERIPYKLTTHIVPAAYWREDPDTELPETPSEDPRLSKDDRKKIVQKAQQRLSQLRKEARKEIAKLDGKIGGRGQTKVMWLCLNRYVRTSPVEGGHTLFFAHANGFNKETWEPTLLALLSSTQSQSLIREIWVWDAFNHGDSALLNQGKLNTIFHWGNAVRDLLTFLLYFIPDPSRATTESLPTHLPRVSVKETTRRLKEGFSSGIVGVGHSFGGCICTLSAISQPSFFRFLFLIDPVIIYPEPDLRPNRLAIGALGRRSVWKDRSAARQAFLQSPFFQAWDPRALEMYVEGGLYETKEGNGTVVRLKMTPLAEATMFIDTSTGCEEAWVRLWRGELPERIGLRWMVPGEGRSELFDPIPTPDGLTPTQARVWLRPANSSNVRADGVGHLVPQEKPVELGLDIQQTLLKLNSNNRGGFAKL